MWLHNSFTPGLVFILSQNKFCSQRFSSIVGLFFFFNKFFFLVLLIKHKHKILQSKCWWAEKQNVAVFCWGKLSVKCTSFNKKVIVIPLPCPFSRGCWWQEISILSVLCYLFGRLPCWSYVCLYKYIYQRFQTKIL